MKILILVSVILIVILLIGRDFIYSAKRNLFKDQEAWSGKDIKIKYSESKETKESKGNDNFLKMIADESKLYLEDQSNKRGNGKN
tara:strand:+ start:543 stop:797 length:255 start_codon:yes stop_codon:yes gene_type:complete